MVVVLGIVYEELTAAITAWPGTTTMTPASFSSASLFFLNGIEQTFIDSEILYLEQGFHFSEIYSGSVGHKTYRTPSDVAFL